jgi:predicted amidophosphoribosyltransferase
MDSLSYSLPNEAPLAPVLLLDDVCTTGNSLIACHNMIQIHQPGRPVAALTLGRTVDE